MISITFHNAPKTSQKNAARRLSNMETPDFALHKPDFTAIARAVRLHKKAKNVLVVGSGGSNTSFRSIYGALFDTATRKAYTLRTMEPYTIGELRGYFPKRETVMVPISRSGGTLGVIEAALALQDYDAHAITLPEASPLRALAEAKGWPVIDHAPMGGRFSGMSATALFPAALCGLDARAIFKGARAMYKTCAPSVPAGKNPAKQLAFFLHACESKGYTELFTPVYSNRLFKTLPLFVQLVHESYAKNGKGQTVFGDLGPEVQHHTNQRFFGGRKNACALFFRVENLAHDRALKVPSLLKAASPFDMLDGLKLSTALEAEFTGTKRAAQHDGIPHSVLSMNKVTPRSMGELIALLQYQAIYGARLRGVNPYDQPHVEASKRFARNYLKRMRRR